jgi:oxygen-independent coproporphyrinogen-3 oxidase
LAASGNLYVQNLKPLPDYEAAVERGTMPSGTRRQRDQDDRIRGEVIQQIMCHGLIEIKALEARHDIVFDGYFAPELKRMQSLQAEGLVKVTAEKIRLTPAGQLLMRVVAMVFDAYLTSAASPPAMSRVV